MIRRYLSKSVTPVLFVASFLFFTIFYRGHIHYQEDSQLFLFTADYFLDLVKLPGGIAAWISRFFIQFFVSSALGGMIYAGLITAVYLSCRSSVRERTFLSDAVALLPALLLWVVFCKEYAQINLAFFIIIPLAASAICRRSNKAPLLFVLLTPVLYWTCGLAAFIFSFASISTKKWWAPVTSLVLVAVLPLIIIMVFPMDTVTLYEDFFYWKDPIINSWWPWVLFATVAVFVSIFSFNVKSNDIAARCIYCISFAGLITVLILFPDYRYEEELQYSYLVREQKWDDIIIKASKKRPYDYFCLADLNLALAMKGRLGEDMFRFRQADVEGLIPKYGKYFDTNLLLSDIYYYLGLTSISQRHMFESKEAIPSMEKGARAYQRLAQTNSINSQFATSRKYLDALSKTLFYRKWVADFNDFSDEMIKYREWRHTEYDFFFSKDNIILTLLYLFEQDKSNEMAFQYVAAYALLMKDMNLFNKILALKPVTKMPRSYQEACMIIWATKHTDMVGLPNFIEDSTVKRFKAFTDAINSKLSPKLIEEQFSDTYWFYYSLPKQD